MGRCPPGQTKLVSDWFLADEDKGRVRHLVTTNQSPLVNSQFVWTDDRNAAIDALDVSRFLFSP